MTWKQWILLAVAVLLGGFSYYLNRDYFRHDNIQIWHRSRPPTGRMGRKKNDLTAAINPIVFGFDAALKLTSLKVIPVADIETNKYPHPIWYLVSDSNSVPTKEFSYGAPIPGMHPAVSGVSPDALEPGVKYRLHVEASKFIAEHDFVPVPRSP